MTTGNTTQSTTNGLHVYTAGVCLQLCVILAFFGLSVFFFRRVRTLPIGKDKGKAKKLMLLLYTSLLLISVSPFSAPSKPFLIMKKWRICFRIVEFSAGSKTPLNNQIEQNEWYVYVFDMAPMFLALLVFHIYHPGKVLVGPDSEYPKVTKEEKRLRKEQKRAVKQEKKRAKSEKRIGNSDVSELVERDIEA
jgi:hypothetical protein